MWPETAKVFPVGSVFLPNQKTSLLYTWLFRPRLSFYFPRCISTWYHLIFMLLFIIQDIRYDQRDGSGFVTLPIKIILPVLFSRIRNINGLSAWKCLTSSFSRGIAPLGIIITVTAAASVPFSSTSI